MSELKSGQPLSADDVKLLVKGDLLRVVEHGMACAGPGDLMIVNDASDGLVFCHKPNEPDFVWQRIPSSRFAFIGRPDADGWMKFEGGNNPVPGCMVEWDCHGMVGTPRLSDELDWPKSSIIAFRLAPTAPVEASGSEREGIMAVIDRNKCEPWTVDRAGQMADEILNLRPQPSGETRDAVARIVEALEGSKDRGDSSVILSQSDLRALLSARPDPVASGGQHSSGEGEEAWLEAEAQLSEISAAIGSVRFMDPPDGGSVTLAEQVRRMRLALEEAEGATTALSVWYGSMPESNGKTNWPAILGRKGDPEFDSIMDGFCFARSEYPERVRYEADEVRWIIGELTEKPCVLDYDEKAHSGYVAPVPAQDDDKLRIAIEALAKWEEFNAYRKSDPLALRFEFETEEDRLAAANALDEVFASLKSTAAQEVGSK